MPKTKKKISRKNNKTLKRKIVRINSKFESGNIIHKKTANGVVNLEIREERSPWYRKKKYNNWFYFKASNLEEKTTFHIGNIRDYFNSWKGFTVLFNMLNVLDCNNKSIVNPCKFHFG